MTFHDLKTEEDAKNTSPLLLQAAKKSTSIVPVWFMRQAGRALPEYRAIRGTGSILEAVEIPELAAEITLQPVKRYNVDAAVLYSDIMVPLKGIGFPIEILSGKGPYIAEPIRTKEDLDRLRIEELDISYVLETIRILKGELSVPLLGFAGGPFTVASYLIEGGPSKNFEATKALMLGDPQFWHKLMQLLTDLSISFLKAQVEAGADAIQLFDSWAGSLAPRHYQSHVLEYSKAVFDAIKPYRVPTIHFGVGTASLIPLMAGSGADVLGLDWRVEIDQVVDATGGRLAIQGNLDPTACLLPFDEVKKEAEMVLKSASRAPGYIFNLGHGVLPSTDPEILKRLVEFVHEHGRGIISAWKDQRQAEGLIR
ncbi:MAG: uroporphyrinogen decarboxylase [Acidimicrobiaceae bacterium]|nr:uroporphyrinogen decarboxylase [Acidimicrobiaceae bacterium]